MTKPQKRLTDLAPKEWFKEPDKSSIWITAFRIIFADKEKLKNGQVYDFEDLRVIIIYGKLQYLETSHIRPAIDNDGNIKLEVDIKNAETPEGGWLIILQPYVVDGAERAEYKIKIKAGVYAALFAAMNGRNMAFERVVDNIAALKDGHTTASSPSFINPGAFPVPDVSKDRCEVIHEAGIILQQKPENDRRRIEFSLHWFEKGIRSMGLDEFVNYWVAIETLGMPDTTNIRPLNQSLAKAYGITLEEATNTFGIGKIFRLRSRILHNGEDLPINQLLSEYMECIFIDILLEHLNLNSERKAIKVLERPEFNLDRLVHIAA